MLVAALNAFSTGEASGMAPPPLSAQRQELLKAGQAWEAQTDIKNRAPEPARSLKEFLMLERQAGGEVFLREAMFAGWREHEDYLGELVSLDELDKKVRTMKADSSAEESARDRYLGLIRLEGADAGRALGRLVLMRPYDFALDIPTSLSAMSGRPFSAEDSAARDRIRQALYSEVLRRLVSDSSFDKQMQAVRTIRAELRRLFSTGTEPAIHPAFLASHEMVAFGSDRPLVERGEMNEAQIRLVMKQARRLLNEIDSQSDLADPLIRGKTGPLREAVLQTKESALPDNVNAAHLYTETDDLATAFGQNLAFLDQVAAAEQVPGVGALMPVELQELMTEEREWRQAVEKGMTEKKYLWFAFPKLQVRQPTGGEGEGYGEVMMYRKVNPEWFKVERLARETTETRQELEVFLRDLFQAREKSFDQFEADVAAAATTQLVGR